MRMRPLVVESGVAECRSRLSATYIGQSSAKIAQWKNLIAPETGWRSPHTLAKASQKSHMHGHVQRHLLALLAPRHAPLWQGARHGRARPRRRDPARHHRAGAAQERKSVGQGKSVSVRVDLGGRLIIKKKNTQP